MSLAPQLPLFHVGESLEIERTYRPNRGDLPLAPPGYLLFNEEASSPPTFPFSERPTSMLRNLALGLLVLVPTVVRAQAPGAPAPKLDTVEQKASYYLGHRFADNLTKEGLAIDVAALMRGVADAVAGKASRLSPTEARKAMEELEKNLAAKQQQKVAELQKQNATFLAENGKKEGVVTLKSGLQYKVLKKGTGPKPKATDTVTVHYTGKLIDGTVFDSSVKRGEPATFPLNRVIPGWTEGLQQMPLGSKYVLFIPGALAYGKRPRPGSGIYPDAVLVFEVELLKINQ